jgi:hypothetical protein
MSIPQSLMWVVVEIKEPIGAVHNLSTDLQYGKDEIVGQSFYGSIVFMD